MLNAKQMLKKTLNCAAVKKAKAKAEALRIKRWDAESKMSDKERAKVQLPRHKLKAEEEMKEAADEGYSGTTYVIEGSENKILTKSLKKELENLGYKVESEFNKVYSPYDCDSTRFEISWGK